MTSARAQGWADLFASARKPRLRPFGWLACVLCLALGPPTSLLASDSADAQVLREAERAYAEGRYDAAFTAAAPLADHGVPAARYLLARLHLRPRSGAFDPREAVRLMRAAAEAGYVRAQHDIAELYRRGVGVERDALNAFRWHLRAAEERHRASEAAIGDMYANGEGVARDTAQASIWKARAARPRPPAARHAERRTVSRIARTAPPPAPAPGLKRSREVPARHRQASGAPPGFIVQLGAYRSRATAEHQRKRVEQAVSGFLKNFEVSVDSRDKGDGNGLLHRLQAGPLADLAAASFTCRTIRKRVPDQGCFATRETR